MKKRTFDTGLRLNFKMADKINTRTDNNDL